MLAMRLELNPSAATPADQLAFATYLGGNGVDTPAGLAVDGNGDIYVAGTFSRASGLSSPGLAKWNGSDWSNIGFAGAAFALVSDGTNLYVGGTFTNAGGVLNTNIARYDGTNWYSMGGGIGYYNNLGSYVYVLELHNGLLYVGGIFTNAGTVAATNDPIDFS